MGKTLKIALALLYAIQVVVIFRESIDHLRGLGHEGERGDIKQNQDQSLTPSAARVLFKRAFQPIYKYQGLLAAAPLAGAMTAASVLTEIKREEDHIHPPERKEILLTRRNRQQRIREYLIANLYPLLKKLGPSPLKNAADIGPIAANRPLLFPGTKK